MERVAITLEEQGNTSSASIPLALDKTIRNGKIKRGDMYVYKPQAKFMFHSNVQPKISSQKADIRRLILCIFRANAARVEGTSEEFESALWNETGFALYKFIESYKTLIQQKIHFYETLR